MTDNNGLLAQFDKNSTEIVRISRTTYREHELVDLRCFYQDDQGAYQPTKKGLTLKPEVFAELVACSVKALDKLGLDVPELDGEHYAADLFGEE